MRDHERDGVESVIGVCRCGYVTLAEYVRGRVRPLPPPPVHGSDVRLHTPTCIVQNTLLRGGNSDSHYDLIG
jgi:hypothetical protein